MNKINNIEIKKVFDSYPTQIKSKLLFLRKLIFNTAEEIEGVGQIEETLKWNQPSYLTVNPKSGSTIRIDQIKSNKNKYAMYFNCKTTLVSTFKQIYPNVFTFQGNRSIIFDVNEKIPIDKVKHCISLALTYHNKKDK